MCYRLAATQAGGPQPIAGQSPRFHSTGCGARTMAYDVAAIHAALGQSMAGGGAKAAVGARVRLPATDEGVG